MHKHSRSTVLGLAVLGLALIAAPAFAQNLFTVNHSDTEGVTGSKAFVPAFLSSNDSTGVMGAAASGLGIYIPYLGTMKPCMANIGETSINVGIIEGSIPDTGACSRWGQASIQAWATGLYYDPRFGTPFIPPSGDHHRTGYRMLMQPSFSGGAWLTGFAPLNQRFPFFPEVGNAGPGGDVGLALANASQQSGLNGILELTDAHGEPLTTGKFPRYWPHERAAWVDTLMVKYTAGSGSGAVGSKFTQSLRSSVGFLRDTTNVRWRAMSNLDGAFSLTPGGASDGCGASGWCEFYIIVDSLGNNHLYVVKNADANTETEDTGAVEITQSTRLDTMGALTNTGKVLKTMTLSNLEKLPTLIDDRLAQVDTDLDGTQEGGVGEGFGVDAGGNPVSVEPGQALFSQFQVVSGPNVHSEEGADPYAWVICGTRGAMYGEHLCDNVGGAIDSGGAEYAIVYNSNFQGQLGDSVLKRFGRDINPNRYNGGTGNNAPVGPGGDPDQNTAVYVACGAGGAGCLSNPGADGMYGTADDGTIYYREAIENGLRGWIRETNGHAFSFLGADFDSTDGKDPNFGLTTMVQQNIEGFLMSCLNCNPHSLPTNVETVEYYFNWPGNFNIEDGSHPPASVTTITVLTP